MTLAPLRHPIQLARGLWLLAILVLRTRGHLDSSYWQWRRQTAMGTTTPLRGSQRVIGVLAYARWMDRMRQLR